MVQVDRREGTFLYISAAIFMAFAIAYLVEPTRMAGTMGISLTATGETDIRATYGGLQAGIAFFLLWTARSKERMMAGLLALFFICSSVAVFRGIGVLISGELGLHYVGFLFEIPLASISAIMVRNRVFAETST